MYEKQAGKSNVLVCFYKPGLIPNSVKDRHLEIMGNSQMVDSIVLILF